MRRLLPLLLLAGCERDPTLFGYWDIVSMRIDTPGGTTDTREQAGFIEITADAKAYAMFAYVYDAGTDGLVPDGTPDLQVFGSDHVPREDFVETYATKGETWSITLTSAVANTFAVEDWAGSSVRLVADNAAPPGPWWHGTEERMHLELELVR